MELLQQGLGEARQALHRLEEGHATGYVAAGRDDLLECIVGQSVSSVTAATSPNAVSCILGAHALKVEFVLLLTRFSVCFRCAGSGPVSGLQGVVFRFCIEQRTIKHQNTTP